MNALSKSLRLAGFVAAAGLALWLYRNNAATESAKKAEEPETRVRLLTRANRAYPLNDRTHYELGKAYFDLGMKDRGTGPAGAGPFKSAVAAFRRSLELNPYSPFAHFELARTLFYAGEEPSSGNAGAFREYRLAAETSGRNSQIFFEVGRVLMSRWKEIRTAEKAFAAGLLKTVLESGDSEKLQILFSTWELNILDYDVMDTLLPDNPNVLRAYARYLGERSLSLDRRQRALARAEFLEFSGAKSDLEAGESARVNYRAAESVVRFEACLLGIRNIALYQDLIGQRSIDPDDFAGVRKSALRGLIESKIETGAALKDMAAELDDYLDMETDPASVGALDDLLVARGLVGEEPEKRLDDLASLEIRLRMFFLQSRYQEIIRIGRVLVQSVIVVPAEKRAAYVRILGVLGDAHMKVENLYDAGDFYRKALDLAPENLTILIKLRQNLRLLSDEPKIREIEESISSILSPGSFPSGIPEIPKGDTYERTLILEGGSAAVSLIFGDAPTDPLPLITVILNSRVIWDGYVRGATLYIPMKARQGRNKLAVTAVNRPAKLASIELGPATGILP